MDLVSSIYKLLSDKFVWGHIGFALASCEGMYKMELIKSVL